MGEHNGGSSTQPSGLLPHGLLPNETGESVIRVLDAERWSMAEERTAELISFIQPNHPSEERRNAVVDYVQRLIMKCFPCHVFNFGSVPLKTYLPDGDIDLTFFSKNQNLKESWASQVRDMLQSEEKNENAEYRVKEVQYIQAEVKIIKCLVENIVVDISFNQLGGLCTLCFLELVDNLINHNHLFKRSIILIKAWCYYESRILGAHHGLISTYALETLVLYIFHVFNNSFSGPLEVLYRFLEFFSKFDWENFCVSLWGPVPLSSLPNVAAEPPRKDSEELLLREAILKACSYVYAVLPAGQENQGTPFVSKHFNVIDPLRVNNNLGRSVSKGNFFRIRSAFAFGAKRLGRLLDCPKEDMYTEINRFFMNTWERHGSGNRPDAPSADLFCLRSSNPEPLHKLQSLGDNSRSELTSNSSASEVAPEGTRGQHSASSQHRSYPSESRSRNNDVVTLIYNQNQKNHASSNSSQASDQVSPETSVSQGARLHKSVKPERAVNDVQGRYLFPRTRSSPELTDTSSDVLSFGQNNRAVKSGNSQVTSIRTDSIRRKAIESETMTRQGNISANDDPVSSSHISSNQNFDIAVDSGSSSHSYWDDQGLGIMGGEHASVIGSQEMCQEEQDFLNMMGSPVGHGFNGQIHVPFNIPPARLPVPPSVLASTGFAHRNMAGMFPANFPVYEHPFTTNYLFPPGVVPAPVTRYFAGAGLTTNPGDFTESVNDKFGVTELDPEEIENDYWHEQEGDSTGGFVLDNGKIGGPSTIPAFGSSTKSLAREKQTSIRNDDDKTVQYLDNGRNEVCLDERNENSRTSPAARSNSLRSKTSSESTWEGSVGKSVKATKDRRGRKVASSGVQPATYGKGKTVPEHASKQEDDDNQDWDISSARNTDMVEQRRELQSLAPLNVPRHQMPGYETVQTSGADSPIDPMIIAPGSYQRQMDGPGVPPLTFYPTGPPVPFVAFLKIFRPERETSDASASHFSREDAAENCDSREQAEPSNNSDTVKSAASGEAPTKHPDILNGDFNSQWQNLLYGRICQSPQQQGPVYPSPAMVPPAYLQGRFSWDGPGRPPSPNMNMFPQPLNYGARLPPLQHYVDDIRRHRSGTGTYLPRVSVREKYSSGNRRGNFNHQRNDHHDDREGNWNNNKYRPVGRNHSRSQAEKSGSRLDRLAASENRSDRQWVSHRPESFSSYQSQNGFWPANYAQSGSTNVAYGMHPVTPINSNGVSSNGPSVPSMVMYPQENSGNFVRSAEQLEFGSLRAVGFSDMNEASQVSEGGRFEEIRFQSNSAPRSLPDQPSSPHHQRRI